MPTKPKSEKAATPTIRQELVRAIRSVARDYEWHLHKAFEEAGCSCSPLRRELEALERQREERMEAAEEEIERELGNRMKALRSQIREIDEQEHPELNAVSYRASHFFALWMMERVADGDTAFLDVDGDGKVRLFADAWLGGWRPSVRR